MTTPSIVGHVTGVAGEPFDDYAERILDAARVQLTRYGLKRTSLEDIAAQAGVGRATLYRRFANRDALLAALVAREAQGLIARVDEHVCAHDDLRDQVVHGFLAFVHELRTHDLLRQLATSDPDRMLPLLGAPATLALGRDYIAAIAHRAQQEGAQLTAPPEQIGELLARLAQSLALTPESVLPLDDDAQLATLARATLAPLIFAAAPVGPAGRRT